MMQGCDTLGCDTLGCDKMKSVFSLSLVMTTNKEKYGEVFTPRVLVNMMIDDALSLMGESFFADKNKVFEIGAGKGIFYRVLVKERNMWGCEGSGDREYDLNEINEEHRGDLEELVGSCRDKHKVMMGDFFDVVQEIEGGFDFVWGNLPFHNGGCGGGGGGGGVGSERGKTVWPKMVHGAFDSLLNVGGYFFCIIPCIWLKEDRAGIYDLFVRKHELCFLKVFDCVEANAMFGYNCQTPICYVMVRKKGIGENSKSKSKSISFHLYDNGAYIPFTLQVGNCIPTKHGALFQEAWERVKDKQEQTCFDIVTKVCCMKKGVLEQAVVQFHKRNMDDVGLLTDYACESAQMYKVITGSSVDSGGGASGGERLILHGVVSTVQGAYQGVPKLILPHKRLPRFFKDYNGDYGCYGRDMYVFLFEGSGGSEENDGSEVRDKIDALEKHLSSHSVAKMIESGFKIRMNFIEKHVFQYI